MPSVDLGSISCSPGIARQLSSGELTMIVNRHRSCDWGDVSPSLRQANDNALRAGRGTVYSSHRLDANRSILVQTDLGSSTFLELAGEQYPGNTFQHWLKTHR